MNKIDIIKALLGDDSSNDTNETKSQTKFPFKVGDKVFLRTVTLYYLGRIKEFIGDHLVLEDASWVQDTGSRLHDFIKSGAETNKSEIEPIVTKLSVNLNNVIDCIEWTHDLPRVQY